jgi:hypothetical protein
VHFDAVDSQRVSVLMNRATGFAVGLKEIQVLN